MAFECESWNGVKSFFSKGGELSKILKKQFRTGGVNIDTIIWLDGSTSTELAYKLRRNGAIKRSDNGPRASHGRIYSKYITDFLGVWSPL